MLLDMVMLSGGIEKSFAELLTAKGYPDSLTPKGTLPFDTEASPRLSRRHSGKASSRSRGLGGRRGPRHLPVRQGRDSLVTLFGYGLQPEAQGLYRCWRERPVTPPIPQACSSALPPPASASQGGGHRHPGRRARPPGCSCPVCSRQLVVRGMVRWVYDYRGPAFRRDCSAGHADDGLRPSRRQGLPAPGRSTRSDSAAGGLVGRLRQEFPRLEVYSVADLVKYFRQRLVYFRQLSYILATMSLIVTRSADCDTTHDHRERAAGRNCNPACHRIARSSIVRQVMIEGAVLTVDRCRPRHSPWARHCPLPRRNSDQLSRTSGGFLLLRSPPGKPRHCRGWCCCCQDLWQDSIPRGWPHARQLPQRFVPRPHESDV